MNSGQTTKDTKMFAKSAGRMRKKNLLDGALNAGGTFTTNANIVTSARASQDDMSQGYLSSQDDLDFFVCCKEICFTVVAEIKVKIQDESRKIQDKFKMEKIHLELKDCNKID